MQTQDPKLIHEAATVAAKAAVAAMGPENMLACNCGFAWVELRPATVAEEAHDLIGGAEEKAFAHTVGDRL